MRALSALGALVVLSALLAGCGDGEASAPAHDPSLEAGDARLSFDRAAQRLTLTQRGQPLLTLPVGAFQLGRVSQLEDTRYYDPVGLAQGAPLAVPDGFAWLAAERAEVEHESATELRLTLAFGAGLRATLRATSSDEQRFLLEWLPVVGDAPVAYLRVAPQVTEAEAFYGLGEYFDTVNHRGKLRPMQMGLEGTTESGLNNAHVPVPFLLSSKGWGLFVENPYPGAFDVARTDATEVAALYGTGSASSAGLRLHLFAEDRPLDLTRHYYAVTGQPRLPARWALGPLVWRNENQDQAEVERDLETMRALDLPTNGLWIDRPYASGVNTFDFNPAQFPDPDAMIAKAHALGFRMALWHTPYLDEKDPATAALLAEARSKGYYPPTQGLTASNKWGTPLDFTNPEAYAWWQALIRRYTSRGIEGFKLDYAEDIAPGLLGARNVWIFSDGSDERTMHRGYTLLYHQIYDETLPEEGGLLLCRAGKYGDQVHNSVIWPGDLDAGLWRHGERVPKDGGGSFVAVGGLHASIVAGLTLGPSGFPFYGADTGGYRHSPPSKETFRRWFEQTALSTVMQIGTGTSDVAWEFGDAELLDSYRQYTRLHLRLFPYEWTYAQQLRVTGRPLQRSLGLAYPELGEHPDDVYLFGDELLVAPVTEAGATARELPLPPGQWRSFWTAELFEGGRHITCPAPLGTLPLFQRVGSIVPLLRPTIDTLSPTTRPAEVDSFATTPGVLHPRVALGPASSFTLYDGTRLSQAGGAPASLGYTPGGEYRFGAEFEVVGVAAPPAGVHANEVPLPRRATLTELRAAERGWAHEGSTLYVKVPPGEQRVTIDG